MSEIIKLYENAGIEKEVIKGCYEYYAENEGIDIYTVNDCKNKDCNTCKADKSIKEYPPFTAEKQIELIKWLILNYSTEITKGRYTNYFMSTGRSYKASGNDDLIICMANLINTLWQDLTEEEKQQVKGILE